MIFILFLVIDDRHGRTRNGSCLGREEKNGLFVGVCEARFFDEDGYMYKERKGERERERERER